MQDIVHVGTGGVGLIPSSWIEASDEMSSGIAFENITEVLVEL